MKQAQSYHSDPSILYAWQAQVAQSARDPGLPQPLVCQQSELWTRFAAHYQALKSLRRPVRRRLQRHWKRSLAGVALLLALGAIPAWAATIQVGGPCTLVQAINAANNAGTAGGTCTQGSAGADTIVLPALSTQNLTRINNATLYGPTGLPTIRSAITINGNGSTIRRTPTAPAFRILTVGETGNLRLLNTTVTGGRAVGAASSTSAGGNGGAVYVAGGLLTLANTTISGNSAKFGGGVDGYTSDIRITHSIISGNTGGGVSGLYSNLDVINSGVSNNAGPGVFDASPEGGVGSITVTSSTISGNSRAGLSGGESGTLKVTNSTISGNDQGIAGGTGEGLDLDLTHSTVTGNARAGVFVNAGGYRTEITLNRSLISGNGGREVFVETSEYSTPSVTVGNFNVFGHSGKARVAGFSPGPTDIVPRQPLNAIISPTLANNGGPTRTHALVAGSPAIDAVFDGTCPPPARDQRGIARPRDGKRDGGPACDVGAFER